MDNRMLYDSLIDARQAHNRDAIFAFSRAINRLNANDLQSAEFWFEHGCMAMQDNPPQTHITAADIQQAAEDELVAWIIKRSEQMRKEGWGDILG